MRSKSIAAVAAACLAAVAGGSFFPTPIRASTGPIPQ